MKNTKRLIGKEHTEQQSIRISLLLLIVLAALVIICSGCRKSVDSIKSTYIESKQDSAGFLQFASSELCFYVISDWGQNGYYYQRYVAEAMARVSDSIGKPDFIISCGDNFQVHGVGSTSDPLWLTNFENVYTHPSHLVDWYPVLGNHDYQGSTQAQIDYSKISRRWRMHNRYYSIVKKVNDSTEVRFIFIDTTPLIGYYYRYPEKYIDIPAQDSVKQMEWLEKTLASADEKWIFVAGHHPVYSGSPKHGNTSELIRKLEPLFEKYGVDIYFCGHDHDMQHLRPSYSKVDYIVTGTGATIRPDSLMEHSIVSFSQPGYTIASIRNDTLRLGFVNEHDSLLYTLQQVAD